jgi:hypothetical protein
MNILLYHHSPFPPGILPELIQIPTNYIIHKKCPIANRIKKILRCERGTAGDFLFMQGIFLSGCAGQEASGARPMGKTGNTYLLWKPGFYGIL